MNFEGGRHCKIIRSIGVPLGLWPYRRTFLGIMNGAFALTIIVLCMVAQLHSDLSRTVKGVFNSGGYLQLAVFTTHEFSVDLFFKIVTGMVPCIFYILKYFIFMWNMEQLLVDSSGRKHFLKVVCFTIFLCILETIVYIVASTGYRAVNSLLVKYGFEWIQSDYDSLTNQRELRLIEKFADRGTLISKFIMYCGTGFFASLGFPILPALFNVGSVNQSRSVLIPISVEYFVDQDRYFYWIMFHIAATMILGAIILIVTESTFVYFAIHACALLEITGDRLEQVLESSILNVLSGKTYLAIHGQLVAAITLHQRALNFIEYFNTYIVPHYCILLVLLVVSLSMNLYILARAMLLMKGTAEIATAVILIVIHFFYMGCGNYLCQTLVDKGNDLFMKTYYARWHESPLPIQKMMLYIRQKSMEPTSLVFGGLYTGSLEFFSKLVDTSMSYFTVLYSTA